jgi:dienelactone hydrolase
MFHVEQRRFLRRTLVGVLAAALSPAALAAPKRVEIAGATSLVGHYQAARAGNAAAKTSPAIILMHGCGGLYYRSGKRTGEITASYQDWADRLHAEGFHVLQLDSFGPRGQQEICTQNPQPVRADVERPRDAHQALAWLAKQPGVDDKRIHLLGWSNGGSAVLNANVPDAYGRGDFGDKALNFRSVVAFYPGCGQLTQNKYRAVAPTLIQAGGADDWTPAALCSQLVKAADTRGARMEIDVYEGAHHSFDRLDVPLRVRPEVNRGKGATVGTHPEARKRAIARTLAFLQQQNQ